MIPLITGYKIKKGIVKVKLLCNENIRISLHMIPSELRYRLYMQEFVKRHNVSERHACKIDNAISFLKTHDFFQIPARIKRYVKQLGIILNENYTVGTDQMKATPECCKSCLIADDDTWKGHLTEHDACRACSVVRQGGEHEIYTHIRKPSPKPDTGILGTGDGGNPISGHGDAA